MATSSSGDIKIEDDSSAVIESKRSSQMGFQPGIKGLEFDTPERVGADVDVIF